MFKYHAFAFPSHYSSGGILDCIGGFNTLEEAQKAVETYRRSGWGNDYQGSITRIDKHGKLRLICEFHTNIEHPERQWAIGFPYEAPEENNANP